MHAVSANGREAIRLLGNIDPDGIEDHMELTRFNRLYQDGEIQGHHMHCSGPDINFLRSLHARQQADAYGIAA